MPLSTAAKAALCLCPPAVMAGTVATVPAAKRAVHHLTAPHHAKPVSRLLTAAVPVPAEAKQPAGCDPAEPAVIPAVPLVTYAAPIPSEPGGDGTGFGPGTTGAIGPVVGALASTAPIAATGSTPPLVGPGPVPEPATWLMLIVGVGAVGTVLRRRYSARSGAAAVGFSLWSGSAAVEAGDVATTIAVKSTVIGAAGKAMLCVCPAAVMAGSVLAVPPLRQVVHASTAVPVAAAPAFALGSSGPCESPTTIAVSAIAVKGFPDQVSTVAPSVAAARNSATGGAAAPTTTT